MFQTVRFIQMMSLTFGLFTQVSGLGPLGPLVFSSQPTVALSSNNDSRWEMGGSKTTLLTR